MPVEDVPGLPRVLLVGDSISMGYTLKVRSCCTGGPWCTVPRRTAATPAAGWISSTPGSAPAIGTDPFQLRPHDQYLDQTGKYVPPGKGKQVTLLPQYEANLRELVARVSVALARPAGLATTTPVPDGTLGRVAGDERRYNETARRVMQELDIPSTTSAPSRGGATSNSNCRRTHFTPAGYDVPAAAVATSLEPQLPPPAP